MTNDITLIYNVFAIVHTCSIMQIFNTYISLCKDYNETHKKFLKGNIDDGLEVKFNLSKLWLLKV